MNGVLFDLDGVIADTSVFHFKAWRKLIQDHFKQDLPPELESQTKGVSRQDSLTAILNYLQITVSQADFANLCNEKNTYYRKLLTDLSSADILPGISELINQLKKHHFKLALASASLNGPLILDKLSLSNSFDAIADPQQVTLGKPAPDIFLAAASAINVKVTDCIGIEDSIAGIQAINSAGAFSIGIGSQAELSQAKFIVPNTAELTFAKMVTAYQNN
ncbi:beta-phosphoglucomutase [Lactobacillus sp. ESL0684]|uniref:beta-phosphoglucomutase n=1 Tax=Lactobacillus sp. ESL0684 TaxID=2983213 RepID=UPI0023F76206|nr:beta-phosphoglucomutase [Lactobacillus sp. ESL0684]WEV44306.1 beta-phosphoglucomutase [Lactobacillus sp. ESL0684]